MLIKLSDYVAEYIKKISDTVFVGQGGSIIHILDSFKKKKLEIIPSQNEQCATIAADAYSRISRTKIGVSAVTSGPGVINTLQGIACSYFDSIPTLTITGQVITSHLRKYKQIRQVGFQEMEVVEMVKPITKYACLLIDKNKIKYELDKLLYYALEGRKGPVLIDIPDDLQRSYIDPRKLANFKIPKKKQKPFPQKKIINLLNNSKKPLIIIGNGVNLSYTKKEVASFVNKLQIPFLLTWATLDLFDHNHPLFAGTFGVAANRYGNFFVQSSDLLLVLGSRLNTQLTGANIKRFSPNSKKIIVDIDDWEFKKNNGIKIDVKVNQDLNFFFKQLKIKKIKIKCSDWLNKINIIKNSFPVYSKKYSIQKNKVNPYFFMKTISNNVKKGDIIIPDASANLIWAYQSFDIFKNQRVFTALNHSPMGYSMPATIGAYLARNKKENVICTIGDGSMAMNVQELATIQHFNFPIKIFVIDNGGYGLIKQTQDTWLASRRVGVDKASGLALPDYIKIAKAYGLRTFTIKKNSEVKKVIDKVLKLKKPALCNVIVDCKQKVIPKLDSGSEIDDMSPKLSRKELEDIRNYLNN
jgi:acetolactate synthase-1/2/3 large subunit